MVRDRCPRQETGFGFAKNKFGLRPECGNATGMIRVEMCKKHRLGVQVQARELRPEIRARLLRIRDAVDPIKKYHRLGVISVGRMLRKGVVEACIHQKVTEAGMVYPMNQDGEIARPMIAIGLLGACGVQIQAGVHVNNTGLKVGERNVARMSEHVAPVCKGGGRNRVRRDLELAKSSTQQVSYQGCNGKNQKGSR